MARPRATSLRTNSGVTNAGQARAEALAVFKPGRRLFGRLRPADILAMGDEDHFLGHDSGASQFKLGHGLAARQRGLRSTALRSFGKPRSTSIAASASV